jgi:hypothetical protein
MKNQKNNPTGKNGRPITLAPLTFEEAVKRMLDTPPPKAEAKAAKPQKKAAKRKP